jgi:hypothetical protein
MTFAAGDDLVQEFAFIRTPGGSPDPSGGVHVQEESQATERNAACIASGCGRGRYRCRRSVRRRFIRSRFRPRKKVFDVHARFTRAGGVAERCGIRTVPMESTSVYWIPLYQILETQGFEVSLVNAQYVRNVPGRKTDVADCQWIQYLHSVGLLRGSFRPDMICAIRSL